MERIDWALLVIESAGTKPLEPVQLQKSLFLLSRNLKSKQLGTKPFYKFEAYDYGPFCRDVYSDAENLAQEELVSITMPLGGRYRSYQATEKGKKKAAELRGTLTEPVRSYLDEVVKFTQSMPFNDLVAAIYNRYPEMKANSVFRGN